MPIPQFTDDPAKANDPNWTYLPKTPGWRETKAEPSKPAPAQQGNVQFNRAEFEKILSEKMGGNPHLANPTAQIEQTFQAELPKAFQFIFKRAYRPWEVLPPEEKKYWDQQQQKLKQNISNQVMAAHKQQVNQWDWSVKQFEKEAELAGARMTPAEKAKVGLLETQTKLAAAETKKAQRPPEWMQKTLIVKTYPEIARKLGLDKTGLTRKDVLTILQKISATYAKEYGIEGGGGPDLGTYIKDTWEAMVKAEQGGGGKEPPPVEGATQAPDGNWYVKKNGKFFKVVKK